MKRHNSQGAQQKRAEAELEQQSQSGDGSIDECFGSIVAQKADDEQYIQISDQQ